MRLSQFFCNFKCSFNPNPLKMRKLINYFSLLFLVIFNLLQTPVQAQWSVVLNTNSALYCLSVVDRDTVFAGGNNVIMRSFDGGLTWQNVLPTHIEINVFDMEVADNAIYASGNSKIIKTTDWGNTWSIVRQSPHAKYQKLSFVSYLLTKQVLENESVGLAFVKGTNADTLLRTIDGGLTWESVSFSFPAYDSTVAYSLQMVNQYTGYLLTDSLYKTTDGGNTWLRISNYCVPPAYPLATMTGNLIGFFNPNVGVIFNNALDDTWEKTTTGGAIMEDIGRPQPEYPATAIWAMNPNVYYASTDIDSGFFLSGGCYVTKDSGTSWELQCGNNYGLDIAMATDSIGYYLAPALDYSGKYSVYRTDHGGWMWTNVGEIGAASTQYYQISPNPAIDELTISANKTLPSGKIEIRIRDISGKSLVEQQLVSYTTIISINHLHSGTYVYEIGTKENILQKGKFVKR